MTAAAVPLFFGDEPRRLFGFLHPAETNARIGLVLCNAFGDEGIRAHRTLRHVAAAAARAGVPALRFDYDGAGDSAGDDRDPDRVRAWIASIHRAVDELRVLADVERVALFGVRLGALLAAEAAATRDDIAGLVALAPVVSGRMHARELRALHRAIGLRDPPTGARPPDGVDDRSTDPRSRSPEDVAGFVLTEETRNALATLDLTKATKRPAPRVLVLERGDLPSNDAWPKRLRELGADVVVERAAGYVEMMLDPHEASVPEAAVAATVAFVAFVARDLDGAASASPAPIEPRTATRVASPAGVLVRESAERIDGLFGILTSPDDEPTNPRTAIVLLNAGAIYRIGPNRLHVQLARRLAARGHLVVRLDLAGLGDSAPHPGDPENVAYPPTARADIDRAVAFLARQPRVQSVHLVGVCSGAYHAFAAAAAGARVASVVPINPLTFFWHDGTSVVLPPHQVAGEAQRYARAVFDPDKWKKLLRGEVDVRAFAAVAGRRALDVGRRRLRDVARRIGRPLPDDLGAELERAARHGVKMRFVFASDDPGFDLLRGGAGSSFELLRRRGHLSVDIIEGPNHTFTQVWSHELVLARVESLLASRR